LLVAGLLVAAGGVAAFLSLRGTTQRDLTDEEAAEFALAA